MGEIVEQCGMRTVGLPHVWSWDALGQKCRFCGVRVDDEADEIAFDLASGAERAAERARER